MTSDPAATTVPGDDSTQLDLLAASLENIPEPVFMKDREHRLIAFNAAFCTMLRRPRAELIGRTDHDFFDREQADRNCALDDRIFATGEPTRSETLVPLPDGGTKLVWTRKYLSRTADGEVIFAITTDVTDLSEKLRLAERLEAEAARQAAVIEGQRQLIDELVVPVLDIGSGVLLVPLVGALTRGRAERAIDRVLRRISEAGAVCVIFDVTGMAELDREVVQVLTRAFAAVRLLGCQSIVVGIGPSSARILIDTGINLDGLTTAATVAQGWALARKR